MSDALKDKRASNIDVAGEAIVITHDDSRLLKRDLIERVKELNCLYSISRLMENHDYTLYQILARVVDLIPPAWQYPEVTAARIIINKRRFQTNNFRETLWEQKEAIVVNGKEVGSLEVCYLRKKPPAYEGSFLKEERTLIHVLAERLGSIIEHKNAESSLQSLYRREKKLRKKLQKEMQSRVDFSRKLIHELKTPLTSLMATSQYLSLLEQIQGSELAKAACLVWEGANRLSSRIEELHDVVKGEVGTLKLNLKPTDIVQLLSSMMDETRALAQDHGISISLEVDQSLPAVTADPERLSQVLLNLINNACKYAPEGKRVIIKATRESASTVKIEVRDHGPGIAKDRQRLLFKPGYQVSHGGESPSGLGIGLTLCKMLVNLQGGKIWAESKLGHGSSFFLTLTVASEGKK